MITTHTKQLQQKTRPNQQLHTRTTITHKNNNYTQEQQLHTICCHNTDYVHINRHDRTITVILAKHGIELPDDGSLVIRNMLEQF